MGGQDGGIQGLFTSFHLRPRVWLQVPISRMEVAWAPGSQMGLERPLEHAAASRAEEEGPSRALPS